MGGTILYLVKKFGKQIGESLDEYSQVKALTSYFRFKTASYQCQFNKDHIYTGKLVLCSCIIRFLGFKLTSYG